jgi:bisphosphoglycerate-independent phosphoglycerate mutase (AlkP superfamily)
LAAEGELSDLAPTILSILELGAPSDMTGIPLTTRP